MTVAKTMTTGIASKWSPPQAIFRSLKTPAFKGFDNSAGSYNSACKVESGRKPVLFMLGNLVFSLLT